MFEVPGSADGYLAKSDQSDNCTADTSCDDDGQENGYSHSKEALLLQAIYPLESFNVYHSDLVKMVVC